ncbi:MAG: tetratricopeptide repeat protein [Gemmatimonadaceae bacterium]
MTTPRIDAFSAMIARNPDNVLARFGLATELVKAERWADAVPELEFYLARYDDEGNGWLKLADAFTHLGRVDEARTALEKGFTAARRFGHEGLAAEFEERKEQL